MIEKILAALEKCGIDSYLIEEEENVSAQLYFIKKSLDMQRTSKVRKADVSVYKSFEENGQKYRGVASVQVQESQTKEEMEKLFADAYYAAGFVKNRDYELYRGESAPLKVVQNGLTEMSPAQIAQGYAKALFAEDNEQNVFINSAEIFAYQDTVHILSSAGVDVAYSRKRAWGEFVVQCVDGQDVETYQSFEYQDWNPEALREKVKDVFAMTAARAKATSAPAAGKYRVILPGRYVSDLLGYYTSRSASHMIYPKYSSFTVGCEVQGEDVSKDFINLTLKADVPFSSEGIPMKDRELVKDGKLQLIHGGNRFAQYLGIEPTGNYRAMSMPAGKVTLEEMKSQPYLEVVNFSDFQMDTFTGSFGGEIRLAFLYDGERVTPVTGGSVNGNIFEAQKTFVFSKELQKECSFEGPRAVCMDGVNVAGI